MIARETPSTGEPGRSNTAESATDGAAPSASGGDNGREHDRENEPGDEPSPFDPLLRHLSELQMLAGHYLRARADQIRARVRTILLWAVAAVIGLIVAVTLLATAVVLALRGIAAGLVALGLQSWAADLLTGVVCIAAVGAILAVVSLSQRSAARRKEARGL